MPAHVVTAAMLHILQVVADSSSLSSAADSPRLALLTAVDAAGTLLVCSCELMELARLECPAWTLRPAPFQASAVAKSVKVLTALELDTCPIYSRKLSLLRDRDCHLEATTRVHAWQRSVDGFTPVLMGGVTTVGLLRARCQWYADGGHEGSADVRGGGPVRQRRRGVGADVADRHCGAAAAAAASDAAVAPHPHAAHRCARVVQTCTVVWHEARPEWGPTAPKPLKDESDTTDERRSPALPTRDSA